MLAGTSVKPPQLDEFFMTGEASLRADEFKAPWLDRGRCLALNDTRREVVAGLRPS
jgi:hypothetical protein